MTTTERDRSIVPAQPSVIADTLAAALGRTWWDDAVMLGGWATGARAFADDETPRGLLAHLAELEDRALELALQRTGEADPVGRGEALDVLRRVRAAAVLLHDAAMQAFSHSALRALQADARTVRHELKNSIGTIRNALSLLHEAAETSTGSEDASTSPGRLHAIALRGTSALEALVRDRVSAVPAADVFLGRAVPLDELVARVVSTVGERATLSAVVLVASESAHAGTVRTRALGLDLVLRSTLIAAARSAAVGSRVSIEALPGENGMTRIRVRPEHLGTAPPDVLEAARELAGMAGLSLAGALEDGGVCVGCGAGDASGRQ